ncbi:hypothetical protein DM01DRAFT_1331788 [Hesseltinella vesiculosa]|uniref:Uncharacterized protein n=1 Tax=Hesseltinella vesiculosa TaxID=101127 RepID=A0A1X2GWE2_9FUNG|nr:hypothetical protein DM01DRAFT_1331788 [Hesseltinella vesiculosa]
MTEDANSTIMQNAASSMFCPLSERDSKKSKDVSPNRQPSTHSSIASFMESTLPRMINLAKSSAQTALDACMRTSTHCAHAIHHTLIVDWDVPGLVQSTWENTADACSALSQTYLRPLTYNLHRSLHAGLGSWLEKKDDLLQYLDDVRASPALELHLISSSLTRRWMILCHHIGIDAYLRHVYRQVTALFDADGIGSLGNLGHSKKPSSSALATSTTDAFSALDGIFQDMVTTDFHGVFYKQQMTRYYQSLSSHEQHLVSYSKRDFIDWATHGAARTHQFVVQTQHDWIELVHGLYDTLESMLDCLSSTSSNNDLPSSLASFRCSPTQRHQAMLLLATHTNQPPRSRYEWMYELDQLYTEVENSIDCICPRSASRKRILPTASAHSPSTPTTMDLDDDFLLDLASPASSDQAGDDLDARGDHPKPNHHGHFKRLLHNHKTTSLIRRPADLPYHPSRPSVDQLLHLKNNMLKRFHRLEKLLHRQLFNAVPPRRQQPMHFLYERLWENVAALNKATYDNYLTQLILSWTNMMANTLDMVNTVADDLNWVAQQQALFNDSQPRPDDHEHTLALIWTSARRKMEKNNLQLINQWEMIFMDMDHELQTAWSDMLAMVDVSHRSSFERVQTFWRHNKARLQHIFSSLFTTPTSLSHPPAEAPLDQHD